MMEYDSYFSRAAAGDAGVGNPAHGRAPRAARRHRLVRARLPVARHVSVGDVPGHHARAAVRSARTACSSTAPTRGYRPLLEVIAAIMRQRGAPTASDRLIVTTGSQQGLDLVARVLLDPGDVVLVELPDLYRGDLRVSQRAGAARRRAAGS